jgi:membrane protein YqaA with SNARE-associated domain
MEKTASPRTLKLIGIIISIIVIAFFIYSVIQYSSLKEEYTQLDESSYFIIFLTTVFLESFPQMVPPLLILSSTILLHVSLFKVILIISLASLLGSMLGFSIGSKYMHKALSSLISDEKQVKAKRVIKKYGRLGLLIIAITPIPYFPLIFGAINMSKKDFLFFGAIPRSLSYFGYGYALFLLV